MKALAQISLTQTAAALGTGAVGYTKAIIQAKGDNAGTAYVGDSATQVFELAKGESVTVEGTVSAVYVKSSAASGDEANVLLM
jgi:hypothetical protein